MTRRGREWAGEASWQITRLSGRYFVVGRPRGEPRVRSSCCYSRAIIDELDASV